MAKDKDIRCRVSSRENERLLELAVMCEASVSETVRAVLPTHERLAVIQEFGGPCGDGEMNLASRLDEIFASAIKWKMTTSHGNHPLPEFEIEKLGPAGTFELFEQWVQAISHQAGVMLPDGTAPRYHFSQYPAGGYWEREGYAGLWGVLPTNERFTPNGIEQDYSVDGGEED